MSFHNNDNDSDDSEKTLPTSNIARHVEIARAKSELMQIRLKQAKQKQKIKKLRAEFDAFDLKDAKVRSTSNSTAPPCANLTESRETLPEEEEPDSKPSAQESKTMNTSSVDKGSENKASPETTAPTPGVPGLAYAPTNTPVPHTQSTVETTLPTPGVPATPMNVPPPGNMAQLMLEFAARRARQSSAAARNRRRNARNGRRTKKHKRYRHRRDE